MKKSFYLSLIIFCSLNISFAQTAVDFEGLDCNGNYHHLFSDLDSGKAVAIIFYMQNCGSCPPVAKKIQAMANNINTQMPDMVRAYAFPYVNSTTCTYSATWTSTNSLPLFMPYDSGAVQVAHYGGFGMPTVVLLGGMDHRVLFSTLSFSTSDTTLMRDSIMALNNDMNPSAVSNLPSVVSSFSVFPNPATNGTYISLTFSEAANAIIDVSDVSGKQIALVANEKLCGTTRKEFDTSNLPAGNYFVRVSTSGKTITQKLTVSH